MAVQRLGPLAWAGMKLGKYKGWSAMTTIRAIPRRIEWIVYQVADDEFRIGVGVPAEHELHTVIGFETTEAAAKANVRDAAHRLGHVW